MSEFYPSKLLVGLVEDYPQLNKLVNHILSLRSKSWDAPENVFVPITVWAQILKQMGELNDKPSNQDILATSTLAALVAWRYSQGVYRFDETLLDSLTATDLDKPLPVDVLTRLPEYAVYIPLPDGLLETMPGVAGTFVSYDYDYRRQQLELRFELFAKDRVIGPVVLPLQTERTIQEELEHVVSAVTARLWQEGKTEEAQKVKSPDTYARDVQKLVSLVLYLCSDKPEVDNLRQPGVSPARLKPKKVKGGMALFPAQQVTVWEVGRSIGQSLRTAAQTKSALGGTHASPRAHIRRGHWHGFWTGPRKGDNRVFVLKWLHPMLVNMDK